METNAVNNMFEVPCQPTIITHHRHPPSSPTIVTHHRHPPSSPIIVACPPPTHTCYNVFKASCPPCFDLVGFTPTHRPLTFASCPPHYVSCSMRPTHLVRSQLGSHLHTHILFPCTFASHLCVLPTSQCHLPRVSSSH